MKATVLSVGTEILFGSIVNTNTVYISQQLQALGIDVMYHMTVGDNPGRLKEILGRIYEDCDMIIVTGGLGPTQDDLTKETIADYFQSKNQLRDDQLKILEERFKEFRRPMTQNNIKQAYFPEGSTVIPNPNGSAPGFIIEKNNKIIISMPGPPREMQPMFDNFVYPWLCEKQNSYLYYKTIRTIDLGESIMETELLPLIDGQSDPTLATYAKDFESTLRVASKRSTMDEAKAAVNNMIVNVREIIGDKIYSEDDEDIDQFVVNKLIENGYSISAAESMTGGAFAKSVTDIAGASSILSSSYVTYSDEEKIKILGVNPDTISCHTVVSEEVAREMAEGLARLTGVDIAISVTGYAGPTGENVGLYYIALSIKKELCKNAKLDGVIEKDGRIVFAAKRHSRAKHGRDYIRRNAVRDMFVMIYRAVLK